MKKTCGPVCSGSTLKTLSTSEDVGVPQTGSGRPTAKIGNRQKEGKRQMNSSFLLLSKDSGIPSSASDKCGEGEEEKSFKIRFANK